MAETPTLLVLNPNSTEAVTDGIAKAVAAVSGMEGVTVECRTNRAGPPGVETDGHVAEVIPQLLQLLAGADAPDATINACFSDPGLAELRAASDAAVFGIGESAYRAAARGNRRFGVVSIVEASVPRHRAYLERLGLAVQLAADLPLNLGVVELADGAKTRDRLLDIASTLKARHGAEAIVLGCAGMAAYRADMEAELAIPVIDPCQAAATDALAYFHNNLLKIS